MKSIAVFLIYLYQMCISPLIGTACRFTPTCSQYAKAAILKHGFLKGSWLGLKRIGRCNPRNLGGVDEVP